MFFVRRLSLLILPAALMLLAAACGDDPTPTPTSPPPPEPATATPTPTPEPRLAQEADGTYVLRDFVVEDGSFELRMGDTANWGYGAGERPFTVHGLVEIVIGPIKVGETVIFSSCRQSGDRSTKAHHMTVEGIGVDHNLDDAYGTGGAAVGDSGDPASNCEFTFDAPGEYIIDDSTDPGEHGVAKFVVEGGGEAVAAGPVTYTMEEFSVDDRIFEFRPAAAASAWGYQDGDQILTDVNEVVITVNLGDRIVLEDGFHSSGSRSSGPHFFTITELGIDVELPQGQRDIMPGFTIEATVLGEFIMHCSLHPDAHGIPMKLIVLDGGARRPDTGAGATDDGGGGAAAAGPVTYTMEEFSVDDRIFEFRPAAAASAWGYQDGDQILTDVNEVVITVNLGDRIVLEDGFHSSGSRSSGPHFFTITELGIDVELPQGQRDIMPGFTIEATVLGEFIMHCSLHPDGHGIPMKLIVLDPGG